MDDLSPAGLNPSSGGSTVAIDEERLSSSPQSLLPADVYYRDSWFDAGRSALFGRTWTAAGSAEDLAAPGDVVAVRSGTDPIFVVRDDEGTLRAFHNLCRHRGYQLVAGECSVGQSITCGYHFWNFRLNGELRNVPQGDTQFGGLDKTQWGLRPAAVAEWEGMVLVHPEPHETLPDWLGEFPGYLGSHHPGRLAEVAHIRYEAPCNWKLFVENHIDVYHLWYLHARTLQQSDHDNFQWWQVGPHWASYESLKKEAYSARREDDLSYKDGHRSAHTSRCGLRRRTGDRPIEAVLARGYPCRRAGPGGCQILSVRHRPARIRPRKTHRTLSPQLSSVARRDRQETVERRPW